MSTSPSWSDVKALFDAALARPAAERSAFVAAAGVSDDVRAEVLSLLTHASDGTRADGWLDAPALASTRIGQRCGNWRLLHLLGSGGMGEVYEAERADGAFEGRAAVKVLKRGLDSAAVLERFARERTALARLSHPHIARLLDAGLSDDGLPFFVMERVDGEPIDAAARSRTLEQRLQLFLQLADAVSHAHRHLLVHRDLKPGNVLVDREGRVKLLDFGIAKAIDPDDADAQATQAPQRVFTPNYASPEQVRGESATTATDVYSLGVLLYELLTGLRPTGRGATTPAEAARRVLEEQPTRPSSLSPQQVPDPQWLATRKRLEGDLDNVLMKALDKTVDGRYASVDAFAADVRAYLGGYPVSAQPHSAAYLAARFVRRHRVPVAAGAVALLAVLAGSGVALWQAHVARAAQARAEQHLAQLRGISRDVVLRYADAVTYLPGGLVVKEDLLKGLLTQLERLEQQAGGDAEWLGLLAGAHARLAQVGGNDGGASLAKMGEARAHAARTIELAASAAAAHAGDATLTLAWAQALQIRARAARADGKPEDGLKDLLEAQRLIDGQLAQATGDVRRDLAIQRASLQLVQAQFLDQQSVASLNQPERALALYAEAERALLALGRDGEARVPALLGTLLGARAITHARLGQLGPAQRDAEQAWQQRRQAVQAEPFNTALRDGLVTEATNAAVVLMRADDPARAVQASQAAWDEVQGLARENGPQSKWIDALPRVAQHHGRALVLTGHDADALPVLERALTFWDRLRQSQQQPAQSVGQAPRLHAWLSVYQAQALAAQGQGARARSGLRAAIDTLEPLAAQPGGRDAQLNLAEACLVMARLEPAQAPLWRERSRRLFDQANARLPLVGDHLRRWHALQSGQPLAGLDGPTAARQPRR